MRMVFESITAGGMEKGEPSHSSSMKVGRQKNLRS
jgi:hypothetical protein